MQNSTKRYVSFVLLYFDCRTILVHGRFDDSSNFVAVNEGGSDRTGPDRTGPDWTGDRIGLRIGSDWYFRFWCRRIILRKAVFNNDTGGSETEKRASSCTRSPCRVMFCSLKPISCRILSGLCQSSLMKPIGRIEASFLWPSISLLYKKVQCYWESLEQYI